MTTTRTAKLAAAAATLAVAAGTFAAAAPAQAAPGYYMRDRNPHANAAVFVRGRAVGKPSCSFLMDGRWFRSNCRVNGVWVAPSGVVWRAHVYLPEIRANLLVYK